MNDSRSDIPELTPARPEAEDGDEKGYLPRLPWKWILGLGAFLALSIGTYQARERREAEALRESILKTYGTQLAPLTKRYDDVAGKIERLTLAAARRSGPTTYVDPRLDLDLLHKGKGLYLRVEASQAKSKESLLAAGADAFPDAIGKCLGLQPQSAFELIARGSFLDPAWLDRARGAEGVMKLRVVAEEIKQRTKRDLPFVAEALNSDWFLLVVQRGPNRRDAAVDAYLWNLRDDKLLLSTRAQADGALVSARIVVNGVKPGNYATGAQTGAAQDCSIAAQLRALAGSAAATFASTPPEPRQAMQPTPAAPAAAAPAPTAPPSP